MRILKQRWLVGCLGAVISLWPAVADAADVKAGDDRGPIQTVRELSRFRSRVTGYPGCDAAALLIEQRFRQIGLSDIAVDEFHVVVPYDRGASVQILESPAKRESYLKVELSCLWPNYVRTPKLPTAGVEGQLIYVKDGNLRHFNGKQVMGAIVLVDFDSSTQWLNASMLGARAIVFIEPDAAFRREAEEKFLKIPVSVPRFWLSKQSLAALGSNLSETPLEGKALLDYLAALGLEQSARVRLKADMTWEERTAKNVIGRIPGTDPELKEQTIIIEAYYDSMSVVPAEAPGAEAACSVAALLEVAKHFVAHPPRRSVELLATAGHFQALCGIRQYLRKHYYEKRKELADKNLQQLFVAIDITSRRNEVGVFYKGHFYDQYGAQDEFRLQREFSDLGDRILKYAEEGQEALGEAASTVFVSGIEPKRGREWRSYIPGAIALDNEVVTLSGTPGIAFVTVNDARTKYDTPLDRFSFFTDLNKQMLREQILLLTEILARVAADPNLPMTMKLKKEYGDSFALVIEENLISYLPSTAIPNALVTVGVNAGKTMMGVRGTDYIFSTQRGFIEFYGLHNKLRYAQQAITAAFKLDPKDGSVSYAMKPKRLPAHTKDREAEWEKRKTDIRYPVFPCVATAVFDLLDQLNFKSLQSMSVLEAESDSAPKDFAIYVGAPSGSYSEPCGVVFTKKDEAIKITMSAGLIGCRLTLLNTQDQQQAKGDQWSGVGFDAGFSENFIYGTSWRAAADMWKLDDARIKTLKKTGVADQRVNTLHDLAGKSLKQATEALEARQYDKYVNLARNAWALESRAYPSVRGTANDVIKGVIFYFAMLLPFVVFAERLLIGFADIRKRLVAIAVIFGIVYVVLRFIHPAFALSQTPVIILIGFFMFSLGIIVVFLLLNKFNAQMATIREKITVVHRADVARASATAAAFMLGIANMRKRKMRTSLTCVTLILLTFTILSFTSFETSTKFNKIPLMGDTYQARYRGILIRWPNFEQLERSAYDNIRNHFEQVGGTVALRSWYTSQNPQETWYLDIANVASPDKTYSARALLGLDPVEKDLLHVDELLECGDWFQEDQPGYPFVCIVPTRMAELLGIDPLNYKGAKVRVLDNVLSVAGIIDSGELYKRTDLDGEPLTPVDYVEMHQRGEQMEGAGASRDAEEKAGASDRVEEILPEQYIHLEPDSTLIIPSSLAVKLGGSLRSIAVGFPEDADEEKTLDLVLQEYVPRLKLILFAGLMDETDKQMKVFLYSSRGALSVKGLKGLLVPIAIASLIVFNTMLGSVFERIREIRIYASVGLAPMHIGSLFFAESCVYASVGSIVGYLIGQIVAKFIHAREMLVGINLNYSSTAAVWTALLVVFIVLLSTLYPAKKAADISVPDETRKMRLPKPEGDDWVFDFPFTVSGAESLGVIMFLRSYFQAHDEDSIGRFCADDIGVLGRLLDDGRLQYTLESMVWVAPLDMGISQKVRIIAMPDPEDEKIYLLRFNIHRESGEVDTWRRINGGFLKDIRKQMLIWRLVDPEHKTELLKEGRGVMEAQGLGEAMAALAAVGAADETPAEAPAETPDEQPRDET